MTLEIQSTDNHLAGEEILADGKPVGRIEWRVIPEDPYDHSIDEVARLRCVYYPAPGQGAVRSSKYATTYSGLLETVRQELAAI